MKPFIKWVGGKSSVINQIEPHLPNFIHSAEFCLIEPFVGGGALSLWALSNIPNLQKLIINDCNADLMNVYQVIKDNPSELIDCISKMQTEYDKLTTLESKKPYFYNQRTLFNERKSDPIVHACLFVFLNKTAFNGLYRVNKRNQFNTPIGSYQKPTFIDPVNILAISEKLQKAQILTGDFEQVLSHTADLNIPCLFYLDPPYRPLTKTSKFTSYSETGFSDTDQQRLALFCQRINSLGHSFLLSNSDPKNHNADDDFFDELYKDFNIHRIHANRSIGAKTGSRKKITEILVSNF